MQIGHTLRYFISGPPENLKLRGAVLTRYLQSFVPLNLSTWDTKKKSENKTEVNFYFNTTFCNTWGGKEYHFSKQKNISLTDWAVMQGTQEYSQNQISQRNIYIVFDFKFSDSWLEIPRTRKSQFYDFKPSRYSWNVTQGDWNNVALW